MLPATPAQGGFAKWIYTDWRGAYDIAAIAKYVDLVCLMTYDQHTRWTMPGPVAGWQWTVDNLNYALKVVPKEKLSLGIPLYGYHWYTGAPTKDSTGEREAQPNRRLHRHPQRPATRQGLRRQNPVGRSRPQRLVLVLPRPDARVDLFY